MNRLKINFQSILILSTVGISFICAPSDPQRLNACNAAMTAAFGEDASPLDCVKKAIKSFKLEGDLISLHDDVKVYYGTFASKIDFTSIVTPPVYCAEKAKGSRFNQKDVEDICNMVLRQFGVYSPLVTQYQLSLVSGVLFGTKQIEKEELELYENNHIINVCVKGGSGYDYLEYTADHIQLLTEDPSVCWKTDHALRTYGRIPHPDNPRHYQLYTTFLRSPSLFCEFQYGSNSD